MSLRKFDVAVIGGGPAGSFCARQAAMAGAKVALCHKDVTRRSSIELLSGRGRWLLRGIDLPSGIDVFETVSLWGFEQPTIKDSIFDPYGPGLAVERAELDSALRKSAIASGAVLIPGRVRSVGRAGSKWMVGDDVMADWVVYATGGAAHPAIEREERTICRQTAFFARYSAEVQPRLWIERTAVGWWYGLPIPTGGLFVGVCSETPLRIDKAIAGTAVMSGLARGTIRSRWGMPASVRSFSRVAGEGWIAVGNSAFCPDPLSGEGIWFSIRSSLPACEVILGRSTVDDYEQFVANAVEDHVRSRRLVLASGSAASS